MIRKILSVALISLLSFSLFAAKPKFALVLSGGGAKGIAEIEVLKELDRRGLYPDYVLGTSIGALVGAFYASGYSGEEIEKLITETDLVPLFLNFYSRSGKKLLEGGTETPETNMLTLDFSSSSVGSSNGIIDDEYVAAFFRANLIKVLPVKDFDLLPIPFRAVGTDAETGEEIIFSGGSLYTAMRGSMAIPMIFAPAVTDDGRYVLDGGMVNNMPTDVARSLGADVVLAVDLGDVLKEHNDGNLYNDIETLTGITFQVMDLVTKPNVVENYRYADFVIIPELSEIGTLDFAKADEILEIGRKAVEDNIEVFDRLEELLGDEEREKPLSYRFIEPFTIQGISITGLEHYGPLFYHFLGRKADYSTTMELESLLQYIKLEEGLKSIGYSVNNGTIEVKAERFRNLSSSVSIGLALDAGVKANLNEDINTDSLFYFKPELSAVFDIALPGSWGEVLAGIDINNYTALFASYYYPLERSFSLFASMRIGSGEISMLSIADRIDRMTTSDFLFSMEFGAAYDYYDTLRIEASVDMDTISLGSIKTLSGNEDSPRMVFFDPMFNINLKYRDLQTLTLEEYGINIDFNADIYMRPPFMYDLMLYIESIIPTPEPRLRFYLNAEADVLRGNKNIYTSYKTNKAGSITRDYLMLETGARVNLGASFFLSFGLYSEGFETRKYDSRLWERTSELAPFALLNDWSLGLSLALGTRQSFGDIMIEVDFSYEGDMSLGVKLK